MEKDHTLQAPRGFGSRKDRGTERETQELSGKVTTARLLEEAAVCSSRAPPSGPGADPAPRPAIGRPPGTSLGEGGGDVADLTPTFTLEAETRGAQGKVSCKEDKMLSTTEL